MDHEDAHAVEIERAGKRRLGQKSECLRGKRGAAFFEIRGIAPAEQHDFVIALNALHVVSLQQGHGVRAEAVFADRVARTQQRVGRRHVGEHAAQRAGVGVNVGHDAYIS